jgi:hypothetical protein
MTTKLVLALTIAAGLAVSNEIKAQSVEKNNNQKKEVKMVEKIKNGNKLIENGVVAGYKIIENGVMSGYKVIEDGFVNKFFKKDGETTEEAKSRLKNVCETEKTE